MPDALLASLSGEVAAMAIVSAAALLAVWVPFQRGLRVCARAGAATRRISRSQLAAGGGGERTASLAMLMLQVLRQALRENPEQPRAFLLDAARQLALAEWEAHYARVLSMYSNILPPIGFIGTTGGLFVLFLSRRLADASLELSALALALASSLFALMGFAALEALKIRLYGRLLLCLEDVAALARGREQTPTPRRASASAA